MGITSGSTQSSSSSNSYGYANSLAQSLNESGQNVWGAQAAPLTNMYAGASNLADQQAGAVGASASALSGQYGGALNSGISSLQNLAGGGGPLAAFTTPNSALAQRQLADATSNIQQQMERVTMPGIQSGAGQAGGIGGGRQGIAQGVAMGDAAQAVGQAGTGIYSNMYNTAAQAAASQADTMLQAGSALPGAATAGYNLGMSPFSSAWGPYSQLAAVLGGPTTLSSSYGISQAAQGQENWAQSQSAGRQRSLGLQLWS